MLLKGKMKNACHLGGGVWDRVGCQFLSGTEVCVAVSLWQEDQGGVGARQGLTWSKTQMQSHIGKVRKREKELCRGPPPLIPSLPLCFPIISPMEEMNRNWTAAAPALTSASNGHRFTAAQMTKTHTEFWWYMQVCVGRRRYGGCTHRRRPKGGRKTGRK